MSPPRRCPQGPGASCPVPWPVSGPNGRAGGKVNFSTVWLQTGLGRSADRHRKTRLQKSEPPPVASGSPG